MSSSIPHLRKLGSAAAFHAFILLFFFCIGLRSAPVHADAVSGYVDLNLVRSDTETRVPGSAVRMKSDGFLQQYGLTISKQLYPKLNLLLNGVFEKDRLESKIDGMESVTTLTKYRPFVDLRLRDPFFSAGVNYSRQESKTRTSGSAQTTLINEAYSGIASWKPAQLPVVEVRAVRTNLYDRNRVSQNAVNDVFSTTARFEPVERLELRYQYMLNDTQDKLRSTDNRTTAHDGKVSYGNAFFNSRVSVAADYENIRRETESEKRVVNTFTEQLVPLNGISSVNDNPASGPLDPNPALVNNDLTAGAGVQIGIPVTTPGARNIGLDLGTETAVTSASLWVAWSGGSIPVEIANQFAWDVYTSADNQNWSFRATVAPAFFDAISNRFDIGTPALNARFLKFVVRPLTPAQAPASPTFAASPDQQISVTEVHAFATRVTANGGRTTVSTTTDIADVIVRVRLLNSPLLMYDFSFFTFTTGREDGDTRRRTTLANGVSANHHFSPVLSGSARVGLEESTDLYTQSTAWVYGATLNALPVRTMSTVLTYNGRMESTDDRQSRRNSFFLNNTANLYRGISAFVSGGLSSETTGDGRSLDSTIFLFGAALTPRYNLTISPNVQSTRVETSGAKFPELVTRTTREDLTVTYIPFRTVYLSVTWSILDQGGRTDRLRSSSANWSPFPGAPLQFTVSYIESKLSFDDSISKTLTESARWNVTNRAYVLLTLFQMHSSSDEQDSRSKGGGLELRYTF